MKNRNTRQNPSKYDNINFFDLKSYKTSLFRPKSYFFLDLSYFPRFLNKIIFGNCIPILLSNSVFGPSTFHIFRIFRISPDFARNLEFKENQIYRYIMYVCRKCMFLVARTYIFTKKTFWDDSTSIILAFSIFRKFHDFFTDIMIF